MPPPAPSPSPSPSASPSLLASALLLLAACATRAPEPEPAPAAASAPAARLLPSELGSTRRVHVLDGLWLASQPSPEDLSEARERGLRTVLNLRRPAEQGEFDERAWVEGLGLTYLALPFGGPEELDDALFDRARELLAGAERPLLVHCASANRVGAVWVPYRVLDGGLELEEAVLEAHAIGLRSAELEAKARAYVARRAEER